jgi:hypothetical protein
MRQVTGRGRWVWRLAGLAAIVALGLPIGRLIVYAGVPEQGPPPQSMTRTVTVPGPVTRLNVQSYGAPVRVTGGRAHRVQVIEMISYYRRDGGPPAVPLPVSAGLLTVADPGCDFSDCTVSFIVTVPAAVAVTVASAGGPVSVFGVAGANVDSGGGPVRAAGIDGPLIVSTEGGGLQLNGVTGTLTADTSGGSLSAQDVAAATATVTTSGGNARIAFAAAPDSVLVSTDGGNATLIVPGGPYALTADSDGGPQQVAIATDPAARRVISATSGGGGLQVMP